MTTVPPSAFANPIRALARSRGAIRLDLRSSHWSSGRRASLSPTSEGEAPRALSAAMAPIVLPAIISFSFHLSSPVASPPSSPQGVKSSELTALPPFQVLLDEHAADVMAVLRGAVGRGLLRARDTTEEPLTVNPLPDREI